MALVKASLQGAIINMMSSFNKVGTTNAKNLANAIADYWSMGMSNLGGVPNPAPCKPIMIAGFIDANSGNKTSVSAAGKIADAIDNGFLAIIISGGKHGMGGIASTQKAILKSGAIDALAISKNYTDYAKKLAQAIDDYTKAGQVYGSGVGPDFVPPSGPLT